MRRLLALLRPYSRHIPLESLFSEAARQSVGRELAQAGIDFPAGKFLSLSLLLSLFLSFYFSATAAFLLSLSFPSFAALFPILFALLFYFFSSFPKREKRKRAALLETDLPMLLRSLALLLSIRMPFERSLKAISDSGFRASHEFAQVHNEIRAGSSVQQALTSFAERVDSSTIKRAVNQLIVSYEHGGKSDSLKRIADELISVQRAGLSEFSAKMAFLTLLFITSSALIPAFFSVFSIVGPLFLSLQLSQLHIWLAYLLFFPAINALILLLIHSRTPPAISSPASSLSSEIERMGSLLSSWNIPLTFAQLAALSIGAAMLLSLSLLLASFAFPQLLPLAMLALLSPLLIYFYLSYKIAKRADEIERSLPDALFHAASLHKSVSMEKIIASLAKSGYGALAEEFAIADRQVKAGASVQSALSSMNSRCGSPLLERANSLLLHGYQSGADMYDALRETAEDMLSFSALVRERSASLALQRYTLLAGTAFLVPLILGTALGISSSLPPIPAGFFGGEAPDLEGIKSASSSAPQFYLLLCSLFSSMLIAQQEGNPKKFLLYFLFLAPVSFLVFSLSLSGNPFGFLA